MTNKELVVETRLFPMPSSLTEPPATVIDSLELLRNSVENLDASDLGEALENFAELKRRLNSLQTTLAKVAACKGCESRVQRAREEIDAEITRMEETALANPWIFTDFLKPQPKKTGSHLEKNGVLIAAVIETPQKLPDSTAELSNAEDTEEFELGSAEISEGRNPAANSGKDEEQRPVINLNFQSEAYSVLEDETSNETDQNLSSAMESETAPEEHRIDAAEPLAGESIEDRADWTGTSAGDDTEEPTGFTNHPEPQRDNSHAGEPSGFDTKLLDDLIKNYGEFVASSPSKPVAKEFEGFERSEPRQENEPDAAAVPIPHPALGQSNQHELDRELKKIIKDYGEVDLYSDGNGITKRRAIVAFAVLGGVLSSIYFFSGPKAETASTPPAIHQNQSTVDSSGTVSVSGTQLNGAGDRAPMTNPGEQPARTGSGTPQTRQRLKK